MSITVGLETEAQAGPFTHEVSQVLRLRNPNSDAVAFKVSQRMTQITSHLSDDKLLQVKTTAPKQYVLHA